jgi:hypothetical protein
MIFTIQPQAGGKKVKEGTSHTYCTVAVSEDKAHTWPDKRIQHIIAIWEDTAHTWPDRRTQHILSQTVV